MKKIRAEMIRVFKAAMKAGIAKMNPAELATIPRAKNKGKLPSAQLTDAEFMQYRKAPSVIEWSAVENQKRANLKLPLVVHRAVQTMALISRTIGGARTGDIHALTWDRFDLFGWSKVSIYRPKVSDRAERIDHYEVPEGCRLHVRRWWWDDMGRPTTGPVFPILTTHSRKGAEGKGLAHEKKNSYAKRFRRDLLAAGVDRAILFDGDETHSPRPTSMHCGGRLQAP